MSVYIKNYIKTNIIYKLFRSVRVTEAKTIFVRIFVRMFIYYTLRKTCCMQLNVAVFTDVGMFYNLKYRHHFPEKITKNF